MTKSYCFSRFYLVIADADRTVFAFRDVSTFVTDDSSCISFLIHEDSYSLSLLEIFFYAIARQLGKMRSKLLGHIYQEDRLLGALCFVIKTFVVHFLYGMYWKTGKKSKSEGEIDFL